MKIPEIVPVSDLRKRAAEVLEKLQESEDPVVVTQRGHIVAVMQSLESYEKTQKEYAVLRGFLEGELDIAEGRGHSLEEVMEEARALLERKRSESQTDPGSQGSIP
jgi:prevent-host-death family protein